MDLFQLPVAWGSSWNFQWPCSMVAWAFPTADSRPLHLQNILLPGIALPQEQHGWWNKLQPNWEELLPSIILVALNFTWPIQVCSRTHCSHRWWKGRERRLQKLFKWTFFITETLLWMHRLVLALSYTPNSTNVTVATAWTRIWTTGWPIRETISVYSKIMQKCTAFIGQSLNTIT